MVPRLPALPRPQQPLHISTVPNTKGLLLLLCVLEGLQTSAIGLPSDQPLLFLPTLCMFLCALTLSNKRSSIIKTLSAAVKNLKTNSRASANLDLKLCRIVHKHPESTRFHRRCVCKFLPISSHFISNMHFAASLLHRR